MRHRLLALVALLGAACKTNSPPSATGGAAMALGGANSSGGRSSSGGSAGGTISAGADGGETSGPEPEPKYHPPPGFESCVHAEVKADCADGWCKLPPSCFVMGSAEGEWMRGLETENQVAVTLTHAIEVQQEELTRAQWREITGLDPRGPESCTDPACPVSMVSWWDAVRAADLLSELRGLEACYEPVGCTGTLGEDFACAGVADAEKSVYGCKGYRLPTRAEAEYAVRAGTWSTFYSGDITPYADASQCVRDSALEKIAWYCFNSGDRAHVGGELEPNGFGLYDMIGNLGEWCADEQRFASSPGGDDPRGNVGTREERLRLSPQYNAWSYILRPASLLSDHWTTRSPATGFRLVRTLSDAPH